MRKIVLSPTTLKLNNNNPSQKPLSFKGSVLQTAKQTKDIAYYAADMSENMASKYGKNGFFIDALQGTIKSGNYRNNKIIDIGSCDGALMRQARTAFSNIQTFGVELNSSLIKLAKKLDKTTHTNKRSKYIQANGINFPFKKENAAAITVSSALHEIFSYSSKALNEKEFSKDSIRRFLDHSINVLKQNGQLIIRDPAKPFNPNERVLLANINKKNSDKMGLSTYSLLVKFCDEFKPLKGLVRKKGSDIEMPKWGASEFIRHRLFNDRPGHWNDEINEQYGTMLPEEIADLSKEIGYKVIKAENIFKPLENNKYALSPDEMVIYDKFGNPLEQGKEFPSNLEVILEK